jgi:hypothetical protein
MIVISNQIVLSSLSDDPNNPLIGWRNLVTVSNVDATTEQTNFPATNLANPSTYLRWKGDDASGVQYLTFAVNTVDLVDYIAVAGHNWGSTQAVVSVEAFIDGYWVEIVQQVILPDDAPALFRFTAQSVVAIRFRLDPGADFLEAAVVYVGKLLVLPRRIYVGHQPIKFNRAANIVTGRSESGQFLGRIVLGETKSTQIAMKNITPLFFREDIEPWFDASLETPFFFVWRPAKYPLEVGYCWASNDPAMTNQLPNGLVEIQMSVQGISP